jgi:hypothetical protein
VKTKFRVVFSILQTLVVITFIYHLALAILCYHIITQINDPNSKYADTPPMQFPIRLESGFDTSYSFNVNYDSVRIIRLVFNSHDRTFWLDSMPSQVQIPMSWKLYKENHLIETDSCDADSIYIGFRDSLTALLHIAEINVLPKQNYSLQIRVDSTIAKLNELKPLLSIERYNPGPETRAFTNSFAFSWLKELLIKLLALASFFVLIFILKRKYLN